MCGCLAVSDVLCADVWLSSMSCYEIDLVLYGVTFCLRLPCGSNGDVVYMGFFYDFYGCNLTAIK